MATTGGQVFKWGLIGAVAAFAIPALVIGGGIGLLGMAVGGALGSIIGAVGVGAGIFAGVSGFAAGGLATGVGGGLLGMFKGARQVKSEQQAFENRAHKHEMSQAHKNGKIYNNGEIAGVQQGYQIGRADGEQVGFQKGQQYVVQQLQAHVQQHMAAQQQMEAAAPESQTKFSDQVASCHCESKVEMVDKQRAQATAAAMAGAQVG